MRSARLASLLLLCWASGCADNRWGLSDPRYFAKYGRETERQSLAREFKQSADARFLGRRTGNYLGTSGQIAPATVGGEIGIFRNHTHSIETHGGLALLAGTTNPDAFVGGTFGARLQAPSRLSPFVGVGTFAGYSRVSKKAEDDNIDNDDDGSVDEYGEVRETINHALAAVYPEVGLHFWFTPRVRLTASASYYVTTTGRDDDFVMYSLNLGCLPRAQLPAATPPPVEYSPVPEIDSPEWAASYKSPAGVSPPIQDQLLETLQQAPGEHEAP